MTTPTPLEKALEGWRESIRIWEAAKMIAEGMEKGTIRYPEKPYGDDCYLNPGEAWSDVSFYQRETVRYGVLVESLRKAAASAGEGDAPSSSPSPRNKDLPAT